MDIPDPDIKLKTLLEGEYSYLEDLKKVDLDKSLDRFQRSLEARSVQGIDHKSVRRYRFLIRAAAAVILLLLVPTTLYFTTFRPAHHIVQARAESTHMDMWLSDGTAISLKEGAVLDYPRKLKSGLREVSLSGEAFFEVRKAEEAPFYVFVGQTTVRVTGTSFNIREELSGSIEVTVLEGEVQFYPSGSEDEAIRIAGGQRAVYKAGKGIMEAEETVSENFLFWRTGTLVFEDVPLPQVFGELEQYFNRKIIVRNPEILQNRWNSVHRDQPFHEIMEELCLYFDLECVVRNDTIQVQSRQQ